MSGYFAFSGLTKFSLARAEAVNAIFSAISAGFDKLPDADALNQGRQNYVTAGGTANDLTVTLPKVPPSYVEGLRMSVKVTQTCTTPATINVNGLGVKAIVRADGSATAAQDLVAGQIVDIQYDGTQFRLIAASEVLAAASAAAASASAGLASGYAGAAALSESHAHDSEVAAAASAAAAVSTSKVSKAGDIMTGQLKMKYTGNDDQIQIFSASPLMSGWNAAGTSRQGFVQFANGNTVLGVDGAGSVTFYTNGFTRATINSAGAASFASTVEAQGIIFARSGGDEKIRMSGSSTAPFLSGYNAAEDTRYGYLQFSATQAVLSTDRFSVALQVGANQGLILDGNKDITGPRNLTITGTMTIAGAAAATQAYVNTAIANLVASSPAALDTLKELADALGDDPNFATTVTNALAGKQATLGFTPYNATNPAGYITSAALSPYITAATADGYRDLPGRATAGSTTLAATDRGGHVVYTGAGGHSFTVPPSVFTNGNIVTIINDGTGNLNIARGAGVVMRWASTGADADRVLAPGGMCAIMRPANGTDRFIVSGAGLT